MEVKLQYNPVFGHVITTWCQGNLEGIRIEYDPEVDEIVKFLWVGLQGKKIQLELIYHYHLTAPGSIQEQKTRVRDFLSEMQLFGKRLWYIQPLVRKAIELAWEENYFEHLNEEVVEDLMNIFVEPGLESYVRQQLAVYGMLELGLTPPVIETLVPKMMEEIIPYVIITPDLFQQ